MRNRNGITTGHPYLDALKEEVGYAGRVIRNRAVQVREPAGPSPLQVAGSALGVGLLTRLFGEWLEPRRRPLSDAYVTGLAIDVDRRLQHGDDLASALGRTLRRRAPVLLERPAPPAASSGAWGPRLLGLSVAAALGAGLYVAARRLVARTSATPHAPSRRNGRGETNTVQMSPVSPRT